MERDVGGLVNQRRVSRRLGDLLSDRYEGEIGSVTNALR